MEREHTQVQMFALKGKIPDHETIMGIRELDDTLNRSNVWKALWFLSWRTSRYGVYARGFEKKLDKPVGATVVWVEDKVRYTFEVPDVRHPSDNNKGLREASGMLDFPLGKLQYDAATRTVSVSSDFNPETDVTVRDIMRPRGRGWARVDADGCPLRTMPSDSRLSETKLSRVRHSDEFHYGATGWHGSLSLDKYRYGFNCGYIDVFVASYPWHVGLGVPLVGRESGAVD